MSLRAEGEAIQKFLLLASVIGMLVVFEAASASKYNQHAVMPAGFQHK